MPPSHQPTPLSSSHPTGAAQPAVSGMMLASCAKARRTSDGIVVEVAGPVIPTSCSEAATVLLDPSVMVAIDCGGPRMNTPLDKVGSPGPLGPVIPSPVQ